MNEDTISKIIENYYRAVTSLMEIGTIEGIPEELRELCTKASGATYKIIEYINKNERGDI